MGNNSNGRRHTRTTRKLLAVKTRIQTIDKMELQLAVEAIPKTQKTTDIGRMNRGLKNVINSIRPYPSATEVSRV